VSNPERWSEVSKAATSLVGGGVSAVMYRTGGGLINQRLLATDMDPAFAASYEAYYGGICPWVLAMPARRPTLLVNDEMLSSAAELERSEFSTDWLRPQDVRYSFDVSIEVGPSQAVDLAGIRPKRLGPLDEHEARAILELVPHLKRAIHLSNRLEIAETNYAVGLSTSRRLGASVILVDANRRVASMDPHAEHVLAAGRVSLRGGQMRVPPSIESQFNEAIARATGNGRTLTGRSATLIAVPRPDGLLPLSLAVGPVDERDRPLGILGTLGPLAMVVITEPERSSGPDEDGLRALFDLTPAEARLVIALCAGETLATYADATGTSLNTAKTHLKHVFEKTGETRQADLVRRVSTDVALRFGT
jgi:DNA-binding CsgD family transcriptional regulator